MGIFGDDDKKEEEKKKENPLNTKPTSFVTSGASVLGDLAFSQDADIASRSLEGLGNTFASLADDAEGNFARLSKTLGVGASSIVKVSDNWRSYNKTLAEVVAQSGVLANNLAKDGRTYQTFSDSLGQTAKRTGESFKDITDGVTKLLSKSIDISATFTSQDDVLTKTTRTFKEYGSAVIVARNVGVDTNEVIETATQLYEQQGQKLGETTRMMLSLNRAVEGTGVTTKQAMDVVGQMSKAYEFLNFDSTEAALAVGKVAAFARDNTEAFKSPLQAVKTYESALQGVAGVQQDIGKSTFFGTMTGAGGKMGLEAGLEFEQMKGPEALQAISGTVGKIFGGRGILTRDQALKEGGSSVGMFVAQRKMLQQELGMNQAQTTKFMEYLSKSQQGGPGAQQAAVAAEKMRADAEKAQLEGTKGDEAFQNNLLDSSHQIQQYLGEIRAELPKTLDRAAAAGYGVVGKSQVGAQVQQNLESASKSAGRLVDNMAKEGVPVALSLDDMLAKVTGTLGTEVKEVSTGVWESAPAQFVKGQISETWSDVKSLLGTSKFEGAAPPVAPAGPASTTPSAFPAVTPTPGGLGLAAPAPAAVGAPPPAPTVVAPIIAPPTATGTQVPAPTVNNVVNAPVTNVTNVAAPSPKSPLGTGAAPSAVAKPTVVVAAPEKKVETKASAYQLSSTDMNAQATFNAAAKTFVAAGAAKEGAKYAYTPALLDKLKGGGTTSAEKGIAMPQQGLATTGDMSKNVKPTLGTSPIPGSANTPQALVESVNKTLGTKQIITKEQAAKGNTETKELYVAQHKMIENSLGMSKSQTTAFMGLLSKMDSPGKLGAQAAQQAKQVQAAALQQKEMMAFKSQLQPGKAHVAPSGPKPILGDKSFLESFWKGSGAGLGTTANQPKPALAAAKLPSIDDLSKTIDILPSKMAQQTKDAQAVLAQKKSYDQAVQQAQSKAAGTAPAPTPASNQPAQLQASINLYVDGNKLTEQIVTVPAFQKGVQKSVQQMTANTYSDSGNTKKG